MIPLAGMSGQVALRLVDATRDKQLGLIEDSAVHSRAIEQFREKVASIDSPKKLVETPEVYTFVMRAFDLEDQIFGKAMIRKVLEGDISDPKALVNRLTDPRMRDLYRSLGFTPNGGSSANVADVAWQEKMVDRYVERQFINDTSDQNATAGTVLEVRRLAPNVNSWFDVLKSKDFSSFMRRALGLPDQVAQLDIDKQVEVLKKKFDLEKLKDPAEVETLVKKYAAISDALDTSFAANNAAVQLMQGAVAAGSGGFVPVTLDISAISSLPRGAYR